MPKKILVIGAGIMGSSITVPAAFNGHNSIIVGTPLDKEIINSLRKDNKHPKLHLPLENAKYLHSDELDQEHIHNADVIVLGISSKGVDWLINFMNKYDFNEKKFLLVTKGLYTDESERINILPEKINKGLKNPIDITVISGPCKASELANKYLTNICFVNNDKQTATNIAKVFENQFYVIEKHEDVIGAEMCAALKNVYAIMVGVSQTIYNHEQKVFNPESGIFVHCIKEMEKFILLHGGKTDTIFGLSGIGDLHVTSGVGRNGSLGKYLGKGKIFSDIIENELKGETVEGSNLLIELAPTIELYINKKIINIKEFPILKELLDTIISNKKIVIPWDKIKYI